MIIKYRDTVDDYIYPPHRATEGSAGFDIYTYKNEVFPPGEIVTVDFGIALKPDRDVFVMLCERSSLHKRGLELVNSIGIIDNDYRGSVKAKIRNFTDKTVRVGEGIALCQLVPFYQGHVEFEDDYFDCDTSRGSGGFGSTGLASYLRSV